MSEMEMTVEALKRCIGQDLFDKAMAQVKAEALGEGASPSSGSQRAGIQKLLLEIGFPSSLRGYRYCVTAIELLLDRPELAGMLTKGLYPEIAKAHNTTATRVERSIRNGVECAYNRGGKEVFRRFFGNTVGGMYGKPTNAEFLTALTNQVGSGDDT